MTIEQLKAEIETYRANCKEKGGKAVIFSENGPVGMKLIDAIFTVVDRQQREIDELKRKY
jgi:hypothetical protein